MNHRWQRAACLMGLLVSAGVDAAGVADQGTWETTLSPRDINRDGTIDAYYDSSQGITWLANADVNGRMTWSDAVTWVAELDVHGVSGWRLPKLVDTAAPGCDASNTGTDCGFNVDTATSEMAHMYFVTLGNLANPHHDAPDQPPGLGLTNTGPFQNLRAFHYWSALPYAPEPSHSWNFIYNVGYQGKFDMDIPAYAWPVHDGDVPAVPEPGTFALALLGLLAVAAGGRMRRLSSSIRV